MEIRSRWHEDTAKSINSYKDSLDKKEIKKYKLDLLLRIAGRLAEFSPECGQCQILQQEITVFVQELGYLIQSPQKEGRKRYFRAINRIIQHFQHEHKLVKSGQYVGLWMAIGSGIGVAIGAGMGSVGGGIPIGVAIGTGIGMMLDAKAKKEGKVI
ncbi:hypothetical protein ACFLXJ_06355 [Chloroflexota bacterium]